MTNDKGEPDTEGDDAVASSREIGGKDAGQPNQDSTTDTDEYVGRVAGDDIGYEEETGAERRADG